jgi:cysteinyl-tRNA synthetase
MTSMIRFHNTLSGRVEPFAPLVPGEAKIYTCGPTVYDYQHIGNCRAYVFEDLLKRFLKFAGFRVTHVMNITDVDDKTIRRAREAGVSLQDYTQKYIEAFFRDLESLRIQPADRYPRATEHIPQMVKIIRTLLDKGYAYRKDGSIYFSIAKFSDYGKLSKIRMEDLKPSGRVESDEYEKESVHDFALWKDRKEGEPFWETEVGTGRPGWHIECSAMSSEYLGPAFDIHCGGVDNIFPHHENEIAQSEAASGGKFVNTWLHCHHLVVDGEKMAKSKGNFYTLADILERGYDPLEVRFLLLSTHYRKMLNFTFEALDQARAGRFRIRDFVVDLRSAGGGGESNPEVGRMIEAARGGFAAGLSDDLNISAALASLFNLIDAVNGIRSRNGMSGADAGALVEFIKEVDEVLAIEPWTVSVRGSVAASGSAGGRADVSDDLSPDLKEKVEERQRARADRDFARADAIRQELLARGIILEDTKDGVRWKRTGPGAS